MKSMGWQTGRLTDTKNVSTHLLDTAVISCAFGLRFLILPWQGEVNELNVDSEKWTARAVLNYGW